jgi:hypothetical protein
VTKLLHISSLRLFRFAIILTLNVPILVGSREYQATISSTELYPFSQLTALEAAENLQDNEIFDVYRKYLPSSKSLLPRFLNLLKKSHKKPANIREKFLNLMISFARGIHTNKIILFLTIYNYSEYLKSTESSSAVTGLHTIYSMFLQPRVWIHNDDQILDPLLHELYADLFPPMEKAYFHESELLVTFNRLYFDEPQVIELSLVFFTLAAASEPSLVTLKLINKLRLNAVTKLDIFEEILPLKFLGSEYLYKSQSELELNIASCVLTPKRTIQALVRLETDISDLSRFEQLETKMLPFSTNKMVEEMYANVYFLSNQILSTGENLNEREELILTGLVAFIETNSDIISRQEFIIETGYEKIRTTLKFTTKRRNLKDWLSTVMQNFGKDGLEMIIILTIFRTIKDGKWKGS